MTTLAIIPARLAASRLPGKPLRLLGGRPLILRVLERVAEMHVAQRCVVSPRDVSRVVAGFGAPPAAGTRNRPVVESGEKRMRRRHHGRAGIA